MDKRIFLKNIGLALLSINSPKVFAEDYSTKGNDYQPHYKYNPFEQQQAILSQNQNYIIENNILPNNQIDFWDKPRKISIRRSDNGQGAELIYHSNGKLNIEAYNYACYLLRDAHQNKYVQMDPKLLDLICAVQSWLKYYGFNNPILINSGYRTLITNSNLEGAAKNSMHLYGKAVDFTVPGLSPMQIAKIAAQFHAGGIGIYPTRNFIHLDTGGVRIWIKK